MTSNERQHRSGRAHPDEIHLPSPSIWPLVCAAGIALLAFGVVTSPMLSFVGVLVMAWALAGWIGQLRHE